MTFFSRLARHLEIGRNEEITVPEFSHGCGNYVGDGLIVAWSGAWTDWRIVPFFLRLNCKRAIDVTGNHAAFFSVV